MRSCACLIVALLACSVVTEATLAATVRVSGGSNALRYVAGAGENNDVTVTEIENSWPSAFVVSDPGATIAVGSGCVSVNAHTAACIARSGSMYNARVELGDGDDVMHPTTAMMRIDGGPGSDRLFGGDSDDHLNGGGGADEIHGGDGDDELSDGDSDDAAGPDVLDGGPGDDWVSYELRAASLRVDISDPRPDGATGEDDLLIDIENVHSGRGDDLLVGDDGSNWFNDEGGTNRMIGKAGADQFRGARAGEVDCGPGTDLVRNATASVRLDRSCETLYRSWQDFGFRVRAYPRRESGGLTLVMWCDSTDGVEFPCSGTVTIVARAGTLARGPIPRGTGRQAAHLRVTPTGRRVLERREVAAVLRLEGSGLPDIAWGLRLGRRDARLSA